MNLNPNIDLHKRLAVIPILALMLTPDAISAADISATYMQSICAQDNPICAPYLKGVFDGLREAASTGGKQIICPHGDIDGGQLKKWFLAAMVAAGNKYNDRSAATMATAAFIIAMPCK